jgi:hypothetical protein
MLLFLHTAWYELNHGRRNPVGLFNTSISPPDAPTQWSESLPIAAIFSGSRGISLLTSTTDLRSVAVPRFSLFLGRLLS